MEAQRIEGNGMMAPQHSALPLTALVVDDDKQMRMIHQRMLNKVGVKNQALQNGKEALDIHRTGLTFDLILMDKEMPVMCGIEATKELRSMGVRSLIVGVSSSNGEAEIREFVEAGLDEYIAKPLTVDTLSSILDKIK